MLNSLPDGQSATENLSQAKSYFDPLDDSLSRPHLRRVRSATPSVKRSPSPAYILSPAPSPSTSLLPTPANDLDKTTEKRSGSALASSSKEEGSAVGARKRKSSGVEAFEAYDARNLPKVPGCRGRARGSQNYNAMDLRLLLGLIRKHKPGATAGWETVGCAYNKYATAAERKLREPNALRVKFEKLCKAAKSTDDTDCSWDVTEIIEHFAIPDTEQGYESEGDPEVEAMPVAKRGRVTYRASPAASEVHDALDPSDVHHRGAVPDMLANWSTAMMLRLEIADLREELRDSERRAYELQSQLNTARMQLIMSGFWEQIESRQALVAEVEHEPRHRRHLSRH